MRAPPLTCNQAPIKQGDLEANWDPVEGKKLKASGVSPYTEKQSRSLIKACVPFPAKVCVSVQVLHQDVWKQTKHFNYSICGNGLARQKKWNKKNFFPVSASVLQNVFDAVSLVASVKQ